MQKKHPTNIIEDRPQKPIVGVDFGTTRSLVAFGDPPEILKDDSGCLDMPTVITYANGAVVCGKDGAFAIKRLLGQKFSAVDHLELPHVRKGTCDSVELHVNGTTVSVQQAVRDFLMHLCQRTSALLNDSPVRAVMTVPAYFSESVRHNLRQCALEAGWEPVRVLTEPTAAALAYDLHKSEGVYLVYDLGGGTFDAALLSVEQGAFRVLALGGDPLLGGDDIDHALAKAVMGENANDEDVQYARSIKEALSTQTKILWERGVSREITKDFLKKVAQPFLEKTFNICDDVLQEGGVTASQVAHVICVGGSVRDPWIMESVQAHTGINCLCDFDPQKVVAFGAARYAQQLSTGTALTLVDALPLSLGIETAGGLMDIIVERNTPIPCSVTQTFTTFVDNQKFVKISVLQGERDIAQHCTKLGVLSVGPLPALRAGVPQIDVTFCVDAEGILSVWVKDKTSGEQFFTFVRDVVHASHKESVVLESAKCALEDAQEVRRISLGRTIYGLAEKIKTLAAQKTVAAEVHAAMDDAVRAAKLGYGAEVLEKKLAFLEHAITHYL